MSQLSQSGAGALENSERTAGLQSMLENPEGVGSNASEGIPQEQGR